MIEPDSDVIVLGGSQAGHAVALELMVLGKTVTLIDDGPMRGSMDRLAGLGAKVVFGTGRIVARDVVAVSGKRFQAGQIVVATGARLYVPDTFPVDGRVVLTAADAQMLGEVPDSAVIVGGGTAGCERASAWADAGCAVTLVESSAGLLPGEDRLSSKMIEDSFRSRGIRLHLGDDATRTEPSAAGTRTTLSSGVVVVSDVVVIATGRKPNIEGLGLEDVGVECSRRGIRVDGYCRTTINGIYAVGEVLRPRRSVRAGYAEAMLVAHRIAGLPVKPLDYESIPRVVRASPQLGAVGLTETQAEDWYGTGCVTTSRYTVAGDDEPFAAAAIIVKLVALVDGPVVGVHVVAEDVECVLAAAKDVYERELCATEGTALLQRALCSGEGLKILVPKPDNFGHALDRMRRRVRPTPSDAHRFSRVASGRRAL